MRLALLLALALLTTADASAQRRRRDAGRPDAGARDSGPADAGTPPADAGGARGGDAGGPDAGADAAAVDRARTLFLQGQQAYAAGRFDEASSRMAAAWEILRSPELAFNAARAYERMSDYANARRFYEIYLRDGAPSEAERADVQAHLAAIAEAEARRSAFVYTAPPSTDELTSEARTFFLRGVTMFNRRQYEAAMSAFLAAYRFAPLAEVIYNLAVTSERMGARQDAIDYYREYLRARPDGPDRGDIEARIARLRESR